MRHQWWLGRLGTIGSLFWVAACSSNTSSDFITLRYYGQTTDRFEMTSGWPTNPWEVCNTFMAVCVDIRLRECVKTPAEFRAPYTRNVTEGEAEKWILPTPHEGQPGDGYMLLVRADFLWESSGQKLKLFSGCNENCTDCWRGTGLALDNFEQDLPDKCAVTHQGGAFAMYYSPGEQAAAQGHYSVNNHINCVESLEDYWRSVEDQSKLVSLINGLVGGGILLLVLVCGLGLFLHVRRKRLNREINWSMQEFQQGRAQFNIVYAMPERSSPERLRISQENIEKMFPAAPVECNGDQPCVVCLQPLSDQLVRKLQCGHCFHATCILEWWLQRPRRDIECPVCRQVQRMQVGTTAQDEVASPTATPAPQTVGATSANNNNDATLRV